MPDYILGSLVATGRTAEVFSLDGQPDRVVKLFFHDFERNAAKEFNIAQKLEALGVAAPRAFETVELNGRTGMVLERIDGSPLLTLLSSRPWMSRPIGRALANLHHSMHKASAEGLQSLTELLQREITHTEALPSGQRDAVLAILETLPDGDRLCHGDFHPGNVLLGERGPSTVDWNNVTSGPPMADVAKTVVLIRSGQPPNVPLFMKLVIRVVRAVLVSSYLRRYNELTPIDRKELRKWQTVIAAARLSERIRNEEDALMALVQKGLADR